MRATTTTFLLSLALVSGALVGCQVFDPSLLPPDDDAVEDGGSEPVELCGKRWPDTPEASDPTDGDPPGFLLFALRNVVLNQTETVEGSARWRSIGYDLDCYDTVDVVSAVTDGHECVPPSEHASNPEGDFTEDNPPEVQTDGREGIDNVFGSRFFPFFESALETISENVIPELPFNEDGVTFQGVAREEQEAGHGTLLLGVEGWNGQLNDRRMTVWIAQAAGGTPCEHKDDVVFNEAGRLVMASDPETLAPPPAWQGNDCWWIRGDAFIDGANPPELSQADDLAYMADGTAVVRLKDREDLQFFAGPVGARVLLTGAMATGRLDGDVSDPSSLRIVDTLVAGRWHLNDLTQSARYVGVCGGPTQFLLTQQLDAWADVRSNPGDPHGLDQACNAISMGVLFEEGIQGHLAQGTPEASLVDVPPLRDWCEEEEM